MEIEGKSISKAYRKRLDRAWKTFLEFSVEVNHMPLPALFSTVMAFLAWLEMSGRVSELTGCLSVVSRAHKVLNLHDPTKDSSVLYVVNGIKKCTAQEA
ncbi:27419_t:CDS:2, partial [Dentiscutata erythropus]